jgi:hypothetical protein
MEQIKPTDNKDSNVVREIVYVDRKRQGLLKRGTKIAGVALGGFLAINTAFDMIKKLPFFKVTERQKVENKQPLVNNLDADQSIRVLQSGVVVDAKITRSSRVAIKGTLPGGRKVELPLTPHQTDRREVTGTVQTDVFVQSAAFKDAFQFDKKTGELKVTIDPNKRHETTLKRPGLPDETITRPAVYAEANTSKVMYDKYGIGTQKETLEENFIDSRGSKIRGLVSPGGTPGLNAATRTYAESLATSSECLETITGDGKLESTIGAAALELFSASNKDAKVKSLTIQFTEPYDTSVGDAAREAFIDEQRAQTPEIEFSSAPTNCGGAELGIFSTDVPISVQPPVNLGKTGSTL